MASPVNQVNGSRYEGASRGERFVAACPETVSGIVGGTSFASATPLVCLGHTSGNKNLLIDYLTVSQNGTVAGGPISLLGYVSTSDRVTGTGASGGTAITPVDLNFAKNGTSDVTFYESRNVGSVTGALKQVCARVAPATVGTTTVISFDEGLLIPKTGCFLLYAFAGTTGPTLRYDVYWREYVAAG